MRHILAFCLLVAAALPGHAQTEKAKPNTLTAKEIADGWILLFDGETAFGWKSTGKTNVKDGCLILAEPKAKIECDWGLRDYELAFDFRCEGPVPKAKEPPKGKEPPKEQAAACFVHLKTCN